MNIFRFLDEWEQEQFNQTKDVSHLVRKHNHFVGREVNISFYLFLSRVELNLGNSSKRSKTVPMSRRFWLM